MNSRSMKTMLGACALVLLSYGSAFAEGKGRKPTRASERGATASEKSEFAKGYAERRRAGDNRNCPCASNPAAYCSCAPHNGYYYGGGYWGGGDPYSTSAGWSRSYWRGSDIPTTGYTAPTSR